MRLEAGGEERSGRLAFEYQEREKFVQVDGCTISYVDEGEGPVLLLVHGIGGSKNNWAPTIEHFSRSHRVIALDLPCHAKSSVVQADGSLALYAGAIRGLLAHLGVARVSIAGNSLGGLITLHIALHHPELVESIILVDNAGSHWFPSPFRWLVRRLPARMLKKLILLTQSTSARYSFLYRFAGIYKMNIYTRNLIEEAVAVARKPDLEAYLEAYMLTGRMAVSVNYADRLGEITRPTLIVWGQKDLGLPLKIGQEENRLIRGSFLVAIPEAAHVPQLDQPELFNAAVERFLAGVKAGADAC